MQILLLALTIMAATFKAMDPSFDGTYFTIEANAKYFLEGGEPLGHWFGAGCRALGLGGIVEAKDFKRVLAGLHPRKPKRLVAPSRKKDKPPSDDAPGPSDDPGDGGEFAPIKKRKKKPRAKRCPAYDITFSMPKDISAVWAIGDEFVSRHIDEAIDISIKKTLQWLEDNVQLARSGHAGKRKQKSKLVWTFHDHSTSRSRSPQPHRHRHCILANMTQRPDGSWTAVNSFELRKWIRTLGPLANVFLAQELRARLGLELVRAKDEKGKDASWFEIKDGVPKALQRHWASRHAELHKLLDGDTIRMDHSTAQARSLAFELTRQEKQRTLPRKVLREMWAAEAKEFGFTKGSVAAMLHKSSANESFKEAYGKAWNAALARATESEAYFNHRQLLQFICEEIQHVGVDADELTRRIQRDLEHSQDIVRLSKADGEMRYTTKVMWDIEEQLLKDVETLQSRPGPIVSEKTIAKVLRKYPELDQEQRKAIRDILLNRSSFKILTGIAGAGKTQVLKAIREILERSGYEVIASAISGQATGELVAKAHISSRTVASYLYHLDKAKRQKLKESARHHARMLLRALIGKPTWKKQRVSLDKKKVFILDEAGMVDTRTLQKLTRHAVKSGCTMLATGDDKQIQPIFAGGPLHYFVKRIQHPHLKTNYRQKDAPLDRKASGALREGQSSDALKNFKERGRVNIGKNRSDTINKLVDAWTKNGGARRPEDHFVFVQMRSEAREVNRRLQEVRLGEHWTPRLAKVQAGGQWIYRGDRVMFHVANRQMGIENGHRATVLSVNPALDRITVRLDRKPVRVPGQKPKKQVVTVLLKALQKAVREPGDLAVTLAYASTTHKLQGGSTKYAYMLVGGHMTDREMSYTQATRGIKETHLFCDALHAGDGLKDLAKSMQKSRVKLMAHDLLKEKKPNRGRRPEIEHTRELS